MAGRPLERYVTQQILEHGGYEALVERIRQGESVAMIARTLFKPDGQAIHRTTLSHMLHARDDRSAQVAAAMVEWRRRPRGERLATRKRLRVTASLRAMRALLGMREPPAPSILPAASRRRTILRTEETPFASPLNELASGAAPITTPPASKPLVGTPPGPAMVIPTSIPELPPKREGVEWDEYRPWCHTCSRGDCLHVKQEYMRRAERYKVEHPPVTARLRGLV